MNPAVKNNFSASTFLYPQVFKLELPPAMNFRGGDGPECERSMVTGWSFEGASFGFVEHFKPGVRCQDSVQFFLNPLGTSSRTFPGELVAIKVNLFQSTVVDSFIKPAKEPLGVWSIASLFFWVPDIVEIPNNQPWKRALGG